MGRWDFAVVGSNGDAFVEHAEESFHRKGLMIAFGDAMVADGEGLTHGDEAGFEFAVIVHNNKATEADFQKEGFHEEGGEVFCGGMRWILANDEASEVAHSD